ncbi:hypothetical protein REPUB_Repub05bG0146600 [Reevesia pubescens]
MSAICWDQWFPEAARAMVLQGAAILFYPPAIGSEPQDEGLDSCDHWRRVMQGHAHAKGANIILIQELFEGYYFSQAQREDFFQRAKPHKNHPTIQRKSHIPDGPGL